MHTTRRSAIFGGLATVTAASGASAALSGCGAAKSSHTEELTKITVLGAIHGRHRDSERYSLGVLEKAIRRAAPDIVISEIPPDRIAEAQRSFAETGEVTEPRTRVFPELTDVVFPLSQEMGFTIAAGAGWTREIADARASALAAIEVDRARAAQWAEHQAARQEYSRALQGRDDDPAFIHTPEYDAAVQRAQTPYQVYFDPDLGPGGWTQINRAHTDLIEHTLDTVRGQGLKVLVIFGSWHKYMIERALMLRSDVDRIDPLSLFT